MGTALAVSNLAGRSRRDFSQREAGFSEWREINVPNCRSRRDFSQREADSARQRELGKAGAAVAAISASVRRCWLDEPRKMCHCRSRRDFSQREAALFPDFEVK